MPNGRLLGLGPGHVCHGLLALLLWLSIWMDGWLACKVCWRLINPILTSINRSADNSFTSVLQPVPFHLALSVAFFFFVVLDWSLCLELRICCCQGKSSGQTIHFGANRLINRGAVRAHEKFQWFSGVLNIIKLKYWAEQVDRYLCLVNLKICNLTGTCVWLT